MSKQSYKRVQHVTIDGVLHKPCNKCGVVQPVTDYHKSKAQADGHHNTCKPCRNGTETRRSRGKRQDPEYLEAQRASQREYARKRRETDREAVNAYQRQWSEANREKARAYVRKFELANPDKGRQRNALRRALKRDATTDGQVDYAAIYAAHDNCYLCGGTLVNPVHMDHVIPLARGGAHSVGNLLPAHARCNLRKHDALLSELDWYRGPVDLGTTSATDE